LEDNYRFSFGKYRLSLCRAANGQLESIPVNLEPDDKNPVLPRQLEFPEPDRSSTEDSQGLDPGKVLSPGTSPGRRRIVMIVSSEAQPPKSDDPRWKDVQRYAILVDTTGSQKERQGGTSDNLSKWEEFCIGRSKDKAGTTLTGEASLISVKGGPQHALPPETEREFERILRWYIRPLR
jgi:hypothetical protein